MTCLLLDIIFPGFFQRQVAMQQDENTSCEAEGETKAAAMKGPAIGNAKAGVTANTRRALGDIGNVVGGRQSNNAEVPLAKKPLPQVDRPMTRSFGAQLANRKALADTTNQANKVESKPDELHEAHPARMKALLNNQNAKAPGLVKERRGRTTLTASLTALSEATCGGKNLAKIPELPSIDAEDEGDQLAVVDYVEDIYSFYRKTEAQSCVASDYMTRQANINHSMRAILVDWLIEVHLKFKLMPETLFLTTNVMDRYLATQSVERKNLQLVGMTSLLIASKYEEIWAPEVSDLLYISDNTYTREQILNMEKTMLNILKFNLCVPTPYMFIVRFLKAATSSEKVDMLDMLTFYFVELCLVDYGMVKFTPSMIAAAAVYTAQCTLMAKEAQWTSLLRHHSGYTESQLLECARKMVSLHERAGEGELTVVRRKYSLEKFGAVAHLKAPALPAVSNID